MSKQPPIKEPPAEKPPQKEPPPDERPKGDPPIPEPPNEVPPEPPADRPPVGEPPPERPEGKVRSEGLVTVSRLSHDGRFLATETVDPATTERVLLLVPLKEEAPREVMRVRAGVSLNDLKRVGIGARVAPASWAPDSQSFIARLQREPEGESELWQVTVDGAPPRKLPSRFGPHVFRFTVSPDGRRVAYRLYESEPAPPQQIWKLENFIRASSPRPK